MRAGVASLEGVALRSRLAVSEDEEEASVVAGRGGQEEEEWRMVHRGHPTLWWLILCPA